MTALAVAGVHGTATVLRFNWPKFVAAAAVAAGALVAVGIGAPWQVTVPLVLAGSGALVWSITSVVATWWSYDHRQVYRLVAAGLGEVGEWVSIHAGFDDATEHLVRDLGPPATAPIALTMSARPSLRRARVLAPAADAEAAPTQLPLADASVDAVLLTFAVHEVRDPGEQAALFAELARVLRPEGRLVITEHHRDLRNAAVYGPAAWHFQTRTTWIRRAADAGFGPPAEVALSPFVHRLVWRRPAHDDLSDRAR